VPRDEDRERGGGDWLDVQGRHSARKAKKAASAAAVSGSHKVCLQHWQHQRMMFVYVVLFGLCVQIASIRILADVDY